MSQYPTKPRRHGLSSLAVLLCLIAPVAGDDWPGWMGSTRDGVWRETGITTNFPTKGLPLLWRALVGGGFSGPAVAGGRVYVMDFIGQGMHTNQASARDQTHGQERILAMEESSGRLL